MYSWCNIILTWDTYSRDMNSFFHSIGLPPSYKQLVYLIHCLELPSTWSSTLLLLKLVYKISLFIDEYKWLKFCFLCVFSYFLLFSLSLCKLLSPTLQHIPFFRKALFTNYMELFESQLESHSTLNLICILLFQWSKQKKDWNVFNSTNLEYRWCELLDEGQTYCCKNWKVYCTDMSFRDIYEGGGITSQTFTRSIWKSEWSA